MLKAKLRNGIWYKVGTVNGKEIKRSLKLPRGTSKAVAEEIVALENTRIIRERVHGPKAVITFDEAALFYMKNKGEAYFKNDKSAARQLGILIKELGSKRMAEITGADLAEIGDKHYPRCKPQSKKRFVYMWVNAIYKMNANAERCDHKVFAAPGVAQRKPVVAAPEEWLDKFVEFATTATNRWGKPLRNGQRVAALVLFISFTGARISEAVRIKPEDIQDRNGDGVLWAYLGKTKNGRARFTKLHPVVMDVLAKLEMMPGKPIFGLKTRHSARDAIERICDGINEAAGVVRVRFEKDGGTGKYRRVREITGSLVVPYLSSHKIGRHAFARRMLDNGYTLMDVKEGGGWESLAVVAENYGHLEKSKVQDAVASVRTEIGQSRGLLRKEK